MERERNEHGQYADGIDPETVREVFDTRDDVARPITAADVVDELGIARRTAHNKLTTLVEQGELETRKVGARARVWWRPVPREDLHAQGKA
jgi:response regulator of citrate/malate metabolism